MKTNRLIAIFTLFVLLTITCVACAPVEDSASHALDNANSVFKSGGDKWFMEPDATPEPR